MNREASKLSRRAAACWLVGAAILITAGCGGSKNSNSGPSALKPINRATLQTLVDSTAKDLLVPGIVVLVRTPQGEFITTTGTIQLGTVTPPTADTYFRIASNTKTMTAAVTMQLVQEGKIKLADPVSKYVSGVPNGDNITISQLMEMRSGLYNYTNAPEISATMDNNPSKVWTPTELLAIAFARPANFPPGTAYEYNNTNYVLLGLVAEKIDNKPLEEVMQARLFGPLGMINTDLPAPAVNALPTPYSHGYLYGSASVAMVGDPPYSEEFKAAARAGTIRPNDFTNLNHSFAGAAGGVYSNAKDAATWIEALVSGRVLNAETQRLWLDSPKPEDPLQPDGQAYGYGIDRLRWAQNVIYFHGGETPGFNSKICYDPVNRVTLVIWTNLTDSLEMKQTTNDLMLKVIEQVYVESPVPASSTPAH